MSRSPSTEPTRGASEPVSATRPGRLSHPALRVACAFGLVGALLVVAVTAGALRAAPPRPTIVPIHHAGRPLRILLVGDSLAGTLEVGLAQAAAESNVEIVNAAHVGCSVAIAWNSAWASSILTPGPPAYPCQSREQLIGSWEAALEEYQPDVVIYASHMDTIDQEVRPGSSSMTSVLDPTFAAALTADLEEAVSVLSSTGAKVILTTGAPTKINLIGNTNDNPARLTTYASIIADVAAGSQGTASVFDLARILGGSGPVPTFSLTSPEGIQWRCGDGIHISPAGGVIIAPDLFTLAWKVAGSEVARTPTLKLVPRSLINQPWPPFEQERTTMGCPND
jgi:hypothetical protein